jgi:hypothetical protein
LQPTNITPRRSVGIVRKYVRSESTERNGGEDVAYISPSAPVAPGRPGMKELFMTAYPTPLHKKSDEATGPKLIELLLKWKQKEK